MIPSDSITIDEDTAWWSVGHFDDLDRFVWEEKYVRPCDTCDGEPIHMDTGAECHDCSGTGRHTFTIEVEVSKSHPHDKRHHRHDLCEHCFGFKRLSVHVVDVLPLVAVDGQIEGEPCVDMITNIWFPCWTREDEPASYLAGHAPIPSAAKPGDWLVKLAIHERNQ